MGEPVVEKTTDLGGGITETTVIEIVGEPTAEDLATIKQYQSVGFEGVVPRPLEVNPTGVGEFFGEYVSSPGTELIKQYKLYGDALPPGDRKAKSSQAAEFAAAQAAAQSAAITKNAQEYDDAVYNLTRDYNLARIERLEAKAAFERQADSQANAYQQQRIQIQIQSIDRQAAESDREFQLQLEGLANQRSDFERSNSTSADPFRALGAGSVGANSPLAAYAKQVMDLGIASDKEKLSINEKLAAQQEGARQSALRDEAKRLALAQQELTNRENNAILAGILGHGSEAIEAAKQGVALDEINRTFTLEEQKIITGFNEVTGAPIMGLASEMEPEMETVSDSSTTGSVLDDAVNGTVGAINKGGYENPIVIKGGYEPLVGVAPEANVFDGLTGTSTETPVRNQGSGLS